MINDELEGLIVGNGFYPSEKAHQMIELNPFGHEAVKG